MRDKYISFIQQHHINDILHYIEDMSYSKKYKMLDNLCKKYSVHIINRALQIYKENYIDIQRVNLYIIENQINYICKQIQDKDK